MPGEWFPLEWEQVVTVVRHEEDVSPLGGHANGQSHHVSAIYRVDSVCENSPNCAHMMCTLLNIGNTSIKSVLFWFK